MRTTAALTVNEHIVHILHIYGGVVEDIIDVEITEIDIVVADRTIGQTPFPVAHDILRRTHPFLVDHTPSDSCGREESPLVAFGELGGSISTEHEFEQVTTLVIIIDASYVRQ